MEPANYTLRLEPKSPETIRVERIQEKLRQRGFQETEDAASNSVRFALQKPAYTLQASLETEGDEPFVHRVSLSLDARRLQMDAVSSAAAELSGVACVLARDEDTPQMVIYEQDTPESQPQDSPECDNPGDLCARLEQRILRKKQALRRFPAISEEEALKWMEDFPQRKEKFVAAVREAKNRDISA